MSDAASNTEMAAELTLLSAEQSDAREKRIFLGWSIAEATAYQGRGVRITFLRNQLLK